MAQANATVGKLRTASVSDQVASRLRETILSGRMKPGERLVERRLADDLGVSLASVRDALQQLDREGLVWRKANTATFVIELSKAKLREMLEARFLLEPKAMVLASQKLTPETIAELQALVDQIQRYTVSRDFYLVSRADFDFHQRIWQLANNETLERLLTQVVSPVFAYLMILMSVKQEDLALRITSHQTLLEVLKRGDAAEIEAAVRVHVDSSWHPFLDKGAPAPAAVTV